MREELVRRLETLDDFQAVRLLEYFSNQLLEGLETPYEEVKAGLPDDFREGGPVAVFETLSAVERSDRLTPEASVQAARALLRILAEDEALAPALQEAMDTYRDDKMMALEILAVGTAVSMVIVAATSSFEGKIGKVKIKKDNATPGQLRALAKLLKGPLAFLRGGGEAEA